MISLPKKWSQLALVALSSLFLAYVGVRKGAYAFAPLPHPSLHRTISYRQGEQSYIPSILRSSGDDENEGGKEWRAFRASLVQNGLPSLDSLDDTTDGNVESSGAFSTNDGRYAHESTPLVEVGTVLLSIPTTDLCQALEQQYWHRAVVLITKVSEDTAIGDVETVPDDQLAQGKNRGRWSYRGVLLNRFTDLVFEHETGEVRTERSKKEGGDDGDDWKIHRGGDLASLDSSDGYTEFTCLHRLDRTDPDVREVSTEIVSDLSMISLCDAQNLCKKNPSKFSPDDFLTFGGFCSWRPGQLELEMGEGREEWLALSVDSTSILEEMQNQLSDSKIAMNSSSTNRGQNVAHELLEAGTNMWQNFLAMIDISESRATERLPAGQLDFYDQILKIWAEENLQVSGDEDDDVDTITAVNDSTDLIGPGTLVRSTSNSSNDVLLFEHEFIRSLVLVLEETPDATVGIILNHPLAAAVECVENKDPLPLRYGGPIDVASWKDGTFRDDFDGDEEEEEEIYEGFLDYQNGVASDDFVFEGGDDDEHDFEDDVEDNEDDSDDSPFIWIHRDAALGSKGPGGGGGIRLGTSDVWIIKENDALESLQSGFLCLEDTMVFSGVCIWEKDPDLGICRGGLREQIDALQSLEIVRACNDQSDNDVIESVWDILSKHQNILEKESFQGNINAAVSAWEACKSKMDSPAEAQSISRVGLSDAVLRAWLGVNLLGDPLGTFVEVRNYKKRELREQ